VAALAGRHAHGGRVPGLLLLLDARHPPRLQGRGRHGLGRRPGRRAPSLVLLRHRRLPDPVRRLQTWLFGIAWWAAASPWSSASCWPWSPCASRARPTSRPWGRWARSRSCSSP
jgi:hypothetical protein